MNPSRSPDSEPPALLPAAPAPAALPIVPAMVTHWGADLRCGFANEAVGSWFGQPAGTFLGQALQTVLGDEQFTLNWPQIEAATLGQGQQFERVVVDAQGVERHLLVFYIPDLGPRPASGGFAAVVADVTNAQYTQVMLNKALADLRLRTAQAEHSARAKADFLANMSHEIRTPINAIIGLGHLLRRDATDTLQGSRLAKLEGAAQHLLQLVNDILDLAKIDAGKVTLERRAFTVDGVLEQAVAMVRLSADDKGLALSVDSSGLPEPLVGDPLRLTQVLINLLSNAVKFTDTGGVHVRALRLAGPAGVKTVRFEVQDSGPGLTPEQQTTLFGRFEQADNALARPHGGTGLGLALVRSYAALMGGQAGVDSQPGSGSTFWFTAELEPAAAEDTARPSDTAAATAQGEGQGWAEAQLRRWHAGQRILVAEDNLVSQEVAVEILQAVGLVVDTAGDGRQALAMVQAGPYALVLMDMQMPGLDGLAATREIRRLHGPGLPIVAMSANAYAEDRAACLAAGMNDHLAKPVPPEQLYLTLLQWLPQPGGPDSQVAGGAGGVSGVSGADGIGAASGAGGDMGDDVGGVAAPHPPLAERLGGIADYDLAHGLATMRGDMDRLVRILRSFVRQYRGGDGALRAAAARGDRPALGAAAHSICGACASLGARAASARAEALQLAAPAADVDALRAAAYAIDADLHRLAAAITHELDLPD